MYVGTRSTAMAAAAFARAGGLRAAGYHADLPEGERRAIEAAYLRGDLDLVVATRDSFGLGIDQQHVRLVLLLTGAGLHAALQQAGRGGRDGQLALVVVCAPSLADPPPRQPALPSAPLEAKRRWCAEGEHAMAGLAAVPGALRG